jgi:hypothetical protein
MDIKQPAIAILAAHLERDHVELDWHVDDTRRERGEIREIASVVDTSGLTEPLNL